MDKNLNFISLAQKAGKVQAGEYLTMKALKEGYAWLVIIAEDTSEKSRMRILRSCEFFECDAVVYGTKDDLGHFTGNRDKSVICITDEGFASALFKRLKSENNQ